MVSQTPELSIVVPCYNSSESLIELVERINATVRSELSVAHEIILVDDASPRQESWSTIVALANRFNEVHGFQLTRNFGRHSALMCGYAQARGQWILTMDDDLQHAPEDIPALFVAREHDVVMGKFAHKYHSTIAKFGSRTTDWLHAKLIGKPRGIYMSPFNLIRRKIIAEFHSVRTARPYLPALLLHVTRDIVSVAVTHYPRKHGKSVYTLRRRVAQFSNLLINNSSLPLRCVAILGISFSLSSIVYALYLIARRLQSDTVPEGWTTLMVVILLVGGIIMFTLGIVGEYLLRIVSGIEQRPAFIVRDRTGSAEPYPSPRDDGDTSENIALSVEKSNADDRPLRDMESQ